MSKTTEIKEINEALFAAGHATRIDELGCNEDFDRLSRKARNEGKQSCAHCGRGVNMDTAWVISMLEPIQTSDTTVFISPFAYETGYEPSLGEVEYVLLGSTCGPKFIRDTKFLTKATAVDASKVRGG